MKKLKCEVKTHIGCTGIAIQRMTGTKKGDPVFYCCMGCHAVLSRQGIKLKEVVTK